VDRSRAWGILARACDPAPSFTPRRGPGCGVHTSRSRGPGRADRTEDRAFALPAAGHRLSHPVRRSPRSRRPRESRRSIDRSPRRARSRAGALSGSGPALPPRRRARPGRNRGAREHRHRPRACPAHARHGAHRSARHRRLGRARMPARRRGRAVAGSPQRRGIPRGPDPLLPALVQDRRAPLHHVGRHAGSRRRPRRARVRDDRSVGRLLRDSRRARLPARAR